MKATPRKTKAPGCRTGAARTPSAASPEPKTYVHMAVHACDMGRLRSSALLREALKSRNRRWRGATLKTLDGFHWNVCWDPEAQEYWAWPLRTAGPQLARAETPQELIGKLETITADMVAMDKRRVEVLHRMVDEIGREVHLNHRYMKEPGGPDRQGALDGR